MRPELSQSDSLDQAGTWPVLVSRRFWSTVRLIPWYFVFGCFSATRTELSGCDGDDVAHNLKGLLCSSLRKDLLTPALDPYTTELVLINPKVQ